MPRRAARGVPAHWPRRQRDNHLALLAVERLARSASVGLRIGVCRPLLIIGRQRVTLSVLGTT